MNTTKWTIRRRIYFDAPKEYREHALKSTRQEVGLKLFDILWTTKLPSTVDIDENIYKAPSEFLNNFMPPDDIIEYTVSITPVQYKDVVVPRYFYRDYDNIYSDPPKKKSKIVEWFLRLFK